MEKINIENLQKNNNQQNNSNLSKAIETENKEDKSEKDIPDKNESKKDSETDSPQKNADSSEKEAPNINNQNPPKIKQPIKKEIEKTEIINPAENTIPTGMVETEEKSNSNNNHNNNSNDSFSKEESMNQAENEEENEDEKTAAPLNNLNMNPQQNPDKNFLGKKHASNKNNHLLSNAIIKKEISPSQKKVVTKKNNKSDKIMDLLESDYEEESEEDEEKEKEKDEDYDINDENQNQNKEKDRNKKKKKQNIKEYKDNEENKENININIRDKENIYYNELDELINKNNFDKVLDCAFKVYNNDFNIKATNSRDYPISKKINDLSNKITKESFQMLLIKLLTNKFNQTQQKLSNLISLPKSKEPEIKIDNKSELNKKNKSIKPSLNKKERVEIEEPEEKIKIENSKVVPPTSMKSQRLASKKKVNYANLINNSSQYKVNYERRSESRSQSQKRSHQKKPSPPFYFGKHFYKKNNMVYCYVPKAKTSSFNHYTLYCINRGSKDHCKAKIVIENNDSKTVFIGNHICRPKLSLEEFYAKYPEVKQNDEWTHVQFAVRNDTPFIISQY